MKYCRLLILAALFWSALSTLASAQVRQRWKLDFKHNKPELFIDRDALDRRRSYWYVYFELTNMGAEAAPLQMEIVLRTGYGKELQDDPSKIQIPEVSSGRYYYSTIHPEVEDKLITKLAKLGDRPKGFISEAIEEYKKNGRYLNARELRLDARGGDRLIRPGETVSSVAIFSDVDLKTRSIELQVAGLVDIVKIEHIEYNTEKGGSETRVTYESQILHVLYDYPGDEFGREGDILTFNKRYWETKNIGPPGTKETLDFLVKLLTMALDNEKSDPKQRKTEVSPLELKIANNLLKYATGQDFGFDYRRALRENETAIEHWHRWWVVNKDRLAYDEKSNKFILKKEDGQ